MATKLTRKTFLSYFGLPTILWRILQAVGYEEGQEPRYSWQKEIYGQDSLVEENTRYDEIGIFLPDSLFLKNLERHVKKAEAIIYAEE